jgi:hypothetical protein
MARFYICQIDNKRLYTKLDKGIIDCTKQTEEIHHHTATYPWPPPPRRRLITEPTQWDIKSYIDEWVISSPTLSLIHVCFHQNLPGWHTVDPAKSLVVKEKTAIWLVSRQCHPFLHVTSMWDKVQPASIVLIKVVERSANQIDGSHYQ